MKNLISKQTELNLLKLGLYQIVGGVAGVLIILWVTYQNPIFTVPAIVLYVFVLAFYLYSIYCGTLCMRARKHALTHSLINQMLQLIGINFLGFAFYYVAGFYIRVGVDITNSIDFDFDVGISNFSMSLLSEPNRLVIDINLIAMGLIFWTDKLRTKVKEELELRRISSIVSSIGD